MPNDIYPSWDLNLDLSALEPSSGPSHLSSTLSGGAHVTSESSRGEGSLLGLEIPPSGTESAGGFGGFELPSSVAGSRRDTRRGIELEEEAGLLPDVGFQFDAEGNLIDLGPQPEEPIESVGREQPRIRSDSLASARMRREHEEGMIAGQQAVGGTKALREQSDAEIV